MAKMNFNITKHDFDKLTTSSMMWGEDWKHQFDLGRFEFAGQQIYKDIYSIPYIYWCDSWASVILCREYLLAHGYDFQPLWDLSLDSFAFLTEFATDFWDEKPGLKVIK